MIRKFILAPAAVLAVGAPALTLVSAASAGLPAPSVTVRVEAANRTLLPASQVAVRVGSVTGHGIPKGACPASSALGALDAATRGSWSGRWEAKYGSVFISKILGVNASAVSKTYWEIFVNDRPAQTGACKLKAPIGSRLLFAQVPFSPAEYPLALHATSSSSGKSLSITVDGYGKTGKAKPVRGATVILGSASARTNSAGVATLPVSGVGPFTVTATAPGYIRDQEIVTAI